MAADEHAAQFSGANDQRESTVGSRPLAGESRMSTAGSRL